MQLSEGAVAGVVLVSASSAPSVALGEDLGDRSRPFSADMDRPLRATVQKDDTRSLRSVGDAVDA